MTETTETPRDALVIGAGITGLFTALALSREGFSVSVLERDLPPPDGDADAAFFDWNRRGAAQFRHPHAFLGLMCNLIGDRYPELLTELEAAGARVVRFADMVPPELQDQYRPEPGDDQFWILSCRRATVETVLRRFVERSSGITINSSVQVDGVVIEDDAVAGVELADGSERRASVTIDASGRTSRFPGWLEAAASTRFPEEREDARIVYYTRHYRLRPGEKEPERVSGRSGAGDLAYLKYGVFPGDNGHFAIILCVPVDELALKKAVRDADTFDTICRSIPGLEPWLAPGKSEPTTDSFGIGDIQAVWRDQWVADAPVVRNFFMVGDSAMRTNPLYGRGCSTGILHAHLLADILAATADPVERVRRFAEATQERLRPIYDASLSEDKRGIRRAAAVLDGNEIEQPDTWKKSLQAAFSEAISAASREQLHVIRGVMRTFHLLEKPGDFLKDWSIRLTILRYMLRGRTRNAAKRLQPGPSRDEMHALLGLDAHAEDLDTADAA